MCWKKTGKGEIGCKIPNIEQYQLMENGIKHLGNHVYTAPSETLPGTEYMVNNFLGVCECAGKRLVKEK